MSEKAAGQKQIVWVMGTSAAGTEAFMMAVVSRSNHGLLTKLGLADKVVVLAVESLRSSSTVGDSPTKKRELILTNVEALAKKADIVLVKWQYVDSAMKLPERLQAQLPKARHRIVYLHVDDSVIQKRLPEKLWWSSKQDVERFYARELHLTLFELKKLTTLFDGAIVDTTTSDYRFLAAIGQREIKNVMPGKQLNALLKETDS